MHQKLFQEDNSEFKANLDYVARPWLKYQTAIL